jgi:hypothetical protein
VYVKDFCAALLLNPSTKKQKHDDAYDAKDNYLMAKQLNLELISPPCKSAAEHLNFRPRQHEVYDNLLGFVDRPVGTFYHYYGCID